MSRDILDIPQNSVFPTVSKHKLYIFTGGFTWTHIFQPWGVSTNTSPPEKKKKLFRVHGIPRFSIWQRWDAQKNLPQNVARRVWVAL